jgi:hypothetical protein
MTQDSPARTCDEKHRADNNAAVTSLILFLPLLHQNEKKQNVHLNVVPEMFPSENFHCIFPFDSFSNGI